MRLSGWIGLLLFTSLNAFPAEARWKPSDKPAQIDCNIGPVDHQIDGDTWLLYGCNDGESIAFRFEDGANGKLIAVFVLVDGRRTVVDKFGAPSGELSQAFNYARSLDLKEIASLYSLAKRQ